MLCHEVETGVCYSHRSHCAVYRRHKQRYTHLPYKATVRAPYTSYYSRPFVIARRPIVVSFRAHFSSDLKHKLISSSSDCVCACSSSACVWVPGQKMDWDGGEGIIVLPLWRLECESDELLSLFCRVSMPFHWTRIQVVFSVALKKALNADDLLLFSILMLFALTHKSFYVARCVRVCVNKRCKIE